MFQSDKALSISAYGKRRFSSTNPYDTTKTPAGTPEIPAQGKYVFCDPITHDYAMYFDGGLVGYARTRPEAERSLDEVACERLYQRTHWPAAPEPLPPVCAVAEALDDLERSASDPTIYAKARDQLAAQVPVTYAGQTRWIGGVVVTLAPIGARWPWPWVCACGEARCWHGALCDAMLLAADRLAEDETPRSPARRRR